MRREQNVTGRSPLISIVPQRMEFFYIINYYFKYWELVDTVFLALKKKPLGTCASATLPLSKF